jgi:hypothetical protein
MQAPEEKVVTSDERKNRFTAFLVSKRLLSQIDKACQEFDVTRSQGSPRLARTAMGSHQTRHACAHTCRCNRAKRRTC